MIDIGGGRPVLVNNILTAVNVATARAQYEETTALQAAEARAEGESEEGTAVEVCSPRQGTHGGQAAC